MQTIKLICVGGLKEKYLRDACSEYAKRLSAYCRLDITEVSEEKLSGESKALIKRTLEREGERILSAVPSGSYVAAMCIEGKQVSSRELSDAVTQLGVRGMSSICFIIGGSYGLSDAVKNRADLKLSMSPMTFPHQLARVMLLEQLYRAYQIAGGGKYHK